MIEDLRKGKNQSQKALMELRDLVLSGKFAAGERLYEVSLSDRIGISRTPLREALSRLEQEGLVERVPSGGFTVRTFSFDDVIDAIELRGVLEGTAARLAAERGVSEENILRIEKIVEALDEVLKVGPKSMNFAAYAELNAGFHACLSDLAGSKIIKREIERSTHLPFAAPSAFLDVQTGILEIRQSLIIAQEQHRQIVEAIKTREGARAEHIAREHARLALKNFEYVMNQDRNLIKRVPGLSLVAG